VSAVLAERHPRTLTTEFYKEKRGTRVFLDTARNTYAQTTVPAYAARAKPKAPVAAPLRWEELSDSKLKPDRWTIKTMPRRLDEVGDPWEGFRGSARALGPAARAVQGS
jgi:bifunctional non-homologous end joining protein LigD